jgi:hypothetical protein
MSRVLLFVQTGSKRPKSRMAIREYWHHPERFAKHIEAWRGHSGRPSDMFEAMAADRWWLVECESADDGRIIILQERVLPPSLKSTLGRILASGDRKVDKT